MKRLRIQPGGKCPKCLKNISARRKTGKKEEDWCYVCYNCDDQIHKEAIIKMEQDDINELVESLKKAYKKPEVRKALKELRKEVL